MTYDPLSAVADVALLISPDVRQQLQALLCMPAKFSELPGVETAAEQGRLSAVFDALLHRLIAAIERHPSKLRIMLQFQVALDAIQVEDTEARELFGLYLECIMDAQHIESSDGLLGFYL